MSAAKRELTRDEIKAIFRRHHGAAAALARELGVTPQSIYEAIRSYGRSRRLKDAVRLRAEDLLREESDE